MNTTTITIQSNNISEISWALNCPVESLELQGDNCVAIIESEFDAEASDCLEGHYSFEMV
jgi:hypothetical protein|tara:strand:+ start:281 stop:460 length:180 start_codon:yes stop_codon:yes gene_type:complete